MTPFEAYREYLALKRHFAGDFDYFKYNGKTNVKPNNFNKRKDKIFYQKLAKHRDVHGFILANLVENEKAWIKDLAYSESAEQIYNDWAVRQQSLTYRVGQDLNELGSGHFDKNFIVEDNGHPVLLQLYLANRISLETLCILLDMSNAKKYWDQKMEYDVVYDSIRTKIEKYTPFIKYDKDKIKKLILDKYSE